MTGVSLRRRLVRLFLLIGVVTVVLVAVIAASLMQVSRSTHERVDVFGPAVLDAQTLVSAYSDQETGVSGYRDVRRSDFLQPYRDARRQERRTLAHLRRLLRDEPDRLAELDDVVAAAGQWRADVARPTIAAVSAGATAPVDAELAKTRFDELRAALDALAGPLRAERDMADGSLRRSQRILDVVLLAALAGLVMLGLLTSRALRQWVIRPLTRLGSEVDMVERGDLEHQIVVPDAPTEIAVLAGQVDRMRARVVANAALAERARADAAEARALVEEQAEDLRRSNTELEQFAYVASHDLQEPLRKVASFCQLIERRYKGQLDERGEQYIEFAVDGAKRMQQLIQDLLMFSRVGRHSAGFQETDMELVLAQALRQLDSAIEEAGAVITHDPLPTLEGDPSLLAQLLQNLVGNGVKFRRAETPRVHLTASRSATPGGWDFACSDNGIGIEPQYADKIFVIFQRLHGRDAYAGTGIGLAMCKKIVEHHGGRLWLDTNPSDTPGTIFRWTLPESQAVPEPSEQDLMTDGEDIA